MRKIIPMSLSILFLLICSGIFLILRCNKNNREKFAFEFYKNSINSKVLEKEIEYNNHHAKIIKLFDVKNEKKWRIKASNSGLNFHELWNNCKPGDLNVKEENTLFLEIRKRDGTKLKVLVEDIHNYLKLK